jgi:hypothetical protein
MRAGHYVKQATGYAAFIEQPLVTVRMVEQRLNCAFVTANKVVKRFVKLRLLDEMTGFQRNRRFRYAPYLALFEPAPPAAHATSKTTTQASNHQRGDVE